MRCVLGPTFTTAYLDMKKAEQEIVIPVRLVSDIQFSSLLVSLSLFHPVFKQLDDGFLHPLRRVGTGEVFADSIHRELQVPISRFLLLHHNAEHGVII